MNGGAQTSAGRAGARPARRAAESPGVTGLGRHPGESGTRDGILAAARASFAELGYDRATIRGIAAKAQVDPALVLHYFGSKEQLFGAALQVPVEPGEVLRRVMSRDVKDMGATSVRAFLEA